MGRQPEVSREGRDTSPLLSTACYCLVKISLTQNPASGGQSTASKRHLKELVCASSHAEVCFPPLRFFSSWIQQNFLHRLVRCMTAVLVALPEIDFAVSLLIPFFATSALQRTLLPTKCRYVGSDFNQVNSWSHGKLTALHASQF